MKIEFEIWEDCGHRWMAQTKEFVSKWWVVPRMLNIPLVEYVEFLLNHRGKLTDTRYAKDGQPLLIFYWDSEEDIKFALKALKEKYM